MYSDKNEQKSIWIQQHLLQSSHILRDSQSKVRSSYFEFRFPSQFFHISVLALMPHDNQSSMSSINGSYLPAKVSWDN